MIVTIVKMERLGILYISLDIHSEYVSIGTKAGFRIFHLWPLRILHREDIVTFRIVEAFPIHPLVGLVAPAESAPYSPRTLIIWSLPNRRVFQELRFEVDISSVSVNNSHLAISTIQKVFVYSADTFKCIGVIEHEISVNKHILSPEPLSKFILSTEVGNVTVWEYGTALSLVTKFSAHRTAIAQIAFSYQGTRCATASLKGTVIRIFHIPTGDKIITFKRGLSSVVTYHLRFSQEGEFLVSSSNTGTVHIYSLSLEPSERSG